MATLHDLPQRQREVLHFIIRHIDDKGASPTFEEIGTATNMKPQQVLKVVIALEKKKKITRNPGAHRSIVVI